MAEEHKEQKEQKEITIKFGKGLVGDPFTAKNGKEYVAIKIPNEDENDKSPWASVVVRSNQVHENQFGKGVWMKLPEGGTVTISRPVKTDQKTPDGKNIWADDKMKVSVSMLKIMLESYKTKERESVIGNLDQKKTEAEKTQKQAPEKSRSNTKKKEAR